MVTKAIWRWLCSAKKRPFFELKIDDLIEVAKKTSESDTTTLERIRDELEYRKRVRRTKKEILLSVLEQKNALRTGDGKIEAEKTDRTKSFLQHGNKQSNVVEMQDRFHGNKQIERQCVLALSDQIDTEGGDERKVSKDETAVSEEKLGEQREVGEQKEAGNDEKAASEKHEGSKKRIVDRTKHPENRKAVKYQYDDQILTNEKISIKTRNALLRNGFTALSELREQSDDDILSYREIGKQALSEIRLALADVRSPDEGQTASKSNKESHVLNDATNVNQLGLDNRIVTCLYRNKVTSLGILLAMSRDDLLQLNGVGESAVESICKILKDLGLELSVGTPTDFGKDVHVHDNAMKIEDIIELDVFRERKRIAYQWLNTMNNDARFAIARYAVHSPGDLLMFIERVEGKTLQEIGDRCGITRERVRQKVAKLENKIGIKTEEIKSFVANLEDLDRELTILDALDKDLTENHSLSNHWISAWRALYCNEPTLLDRISMFKKYNIPLTLQEINNHLEIVTIAAGGYGGSDYWSNDNLRNLIWAVSNKLGCPGKMPKQVELPRLVSRYVQKNGGQRHVASMFGFKYEGPVGTRNRSYWNRERIMDAVLNTQKYFCLPQTIMPEQCQINFYLDKDNNDMTKGPSCLAAIKREGSWEDFSMRNKLLLYERLEAHDRDRIDWHIIRTLWNERYPFEGRDDFLDVFTVFMNQFWNAPAQPLKYCSLVEKARQIGHLIQSGEIPGDSPLALDEIEQHNKKRLEPEEECNDGLDRFVELLF